MPKAQTKEAGEAAKEKEAPEEKEVAKEKEAPKEKEVVKEKRGKAELTKEQFFGHLDNLTVLELSRSSGRHGWLWSPSAARCCTGRRGEVRVYCGFKRYW